MGKLLCDSSAVAETTFETSSPAWRDPTNNAAVVAAAAVDLAVDQTIAVAAEATTVTGGWDDVVGLEDQQRRHLKKLYAKGVLWKLPVGDGDGGNAALSDDSSRSVVFRLSHGGEVSSDGNCLFTASQRAMSMAREMDARGLRLRTVRRFLEDFGSAAEDEKSVINDAIRHMYSPDLNNGWGIHIVQEVKLLAKKDDRSNLDSGIDELVQLGMQRPLAEESIYKERCIPVNDGASWAKYMAISGSPEDEHDIITLQYTEEGLLSVEENREGHAAAFGDDIAIECIATEFKREIFVVQAHGSDAMVDEDHCVFFLPHRPRSEICHPPFFLFMKGTGWSVAGADHYEPLIAHPSPVVVSPEKVGLVL
ncbi:unnamed protein product [Linum trigynum]|uniref:OTU domain-containing protein n=1 Tax=Linum trigynum TaxID=586398 RepID=A0AAV2CEW7_9ROSI